MCRTNTLFDRTCSDKINTVFPRKEARAPPISYCGLFVVKIQHKINRQLRIRTQAFMVEDYQAYQTRHLDGQLENQDVDADYGRGHGSIILPIIINYYCLIQTVYTVLNINDSNKKMVSYEYTEQTQ